MKPAGQIFIQVHKNISPVKVCVKPAGQIFIQISKTSSGFRLMVSGPVSSVSPIHQENAGLHLESVVQVRRVRQRRSAGRGMAFGHVRHQLGGPGPRKIG